VSPSNGTTTVSATAYAPRVGADVKITDFPLIERLRNLLNAVEQFPNLLSPERLEARRGQGGSVTGAERNDACGKTTNVTVILFITSMAAVPLRRKCDVLLNRHGHRFGLSPTRRDPGAGSAPVEIYGKQDRNDAAEARVLGEGGS
jgi:hypothetical protein